MVEKWPWGRGENLGIIQLSLSNYRFVVQLLNITVRVLSQSIDLQLLLSNYQLVLQLLNTTA